MTNPDSEPPCPCTIVCSPSQPIAVPYDQRQVGDLVFVVTRARITIPDDWTDVSWNRDTNPHIEAWRIVCHGDGDVYKTWNIDLETALVMVFRYIQMT